MRNYLITGNQGFIGSNYIETIIGDKNNYIVGLDYLSNAANKKNCPYESYNNYKFIYGNINDVGLVRYILEEFKIDTVINFAAESHVDNSIDNPVYFTENNVTGTHLLVNTVHQYWKNCKTNNNLFIQISTDEVYGQRNLSSDYESIETDQIITRSPYSASKAASENIVQSYIYTYNFPAIITRSCNNFGPKQFIEKLIPKTIDCLICDRNIPIYGDGLNVRDWIYVKDNCNAINHIIKYGKLGEIYNIGANNLINNITLVNFIISTYENITGINKAYLKKFVSDRLGHDRKYNISTNKLKQLQPKWQMPDNNLFMQNLKTTVQWYIDNIKEYNKE